MKVLFISSEVAPYSKTGGLADVAGALPPALAAAGHEVTVVTPLYGSIAKRDELPRIPRVLTLKLPVGEIRGAMRVTEPAPNHRVVFLEHEAFFNRPALYGDARGDYGDNAHRFAFLALGALAAAQHLDFPADVVHLNDWQTGLAAVALKRGFRGSALGRAKSVFTIHNLAYQGIFPRHVGEELGLPPDLFYPEGVEFHGNLSFMKAGLAYSDRITTVSPTYAEEIQTPDAGWGLDGLLRRRRGDLIGILNGIDEKEWDPATDRFLPAKYTPADLTGKALCKAELRKRLGLQLEGDPPVFGLVSRLVEQKGLDILLPVLPGILQRGAQLAILGSGEQRYEWALGELAHHFRGRAGVKIGYDNSLAHLIEAGSDFFLMPSQYEPCGLNQMYSLRYGTPPIVRAVGGLEDTVTDAHLPTGTGLKFAPYSPDALWHTLERALALYGDGARLLEIRQRGMGQDFSWGRAAKAYEALYHEVCALPHAQKAL